MDYITDPKRFKCRPIFFLLSFFWNPWKKGINVRAASVKHCLRMGASRCVRRWWWDACNGVRQPWGPRPGLPKSSSGSTRGAEHFFYFITTTTMGVGHQDHKGLLHDLFEAVSLLVGTPLWDLEARALTALYQWRKEARKLKRNTEIQEIEYQKSFWRNDRNE